MRTDRLWGLALAALMPTPLAGQQLADRIVSADGEVRLSYRTRDGVCGDGRSMINTSGGQWKGRPGSRCEPGPARMTLTVRDGRVRAADLRIGGSWSPRAAGRDLGTVGARDAAEALLALAGRPNTRGDDLILGSVLADSVVVWPSLLALARRTAIDEDIRDDAVLWLGFAAGDALGPDAADSEDDVRETVIFALSQRPADEAIPALVRVIEGDHPVHLKKSALFWLGQTDRRRAVDVYEEILRDG